MTVIRSETLARLIVAWTIAGYPMLGVLVAYTSFPSLLASIPVRLFVAVAALVLIARLRQPFTKLGICVMAFFCIYLIRLIADIASDVPNTFFDLSFFILTALLPALAVSRIKYWDEQNLARLLVWMGGITALASVCAEYFPLLATRSLLEETGRAGFDTVNPITLGHVAVSTLVALAVLTKRRRKWLFLWLIGFSLSITMLVEAASKGPIVSLLIVTGCWFLVGKKGLYWKIFYFLALVFILIGFLYCGQESELINRFVYLSEDKSSIDRVNLLLNAIEQFIDHPIMGSAHLELETLTHPHNILIESAMATGIGGAVLLIMIVVAVVVAILRRLYSGERLIPLLGVQYLVNANLSGSLYASSEFWVLTAILVMTPKVGYSRQTAIVNS